MLSVYGYRTDIYSENLDFKLPHSGRYGQAPGGIRVSSLGPICIADRRH